jgi:hypothetical protein
MKSKKVEEILMNLLSSGGDTSTSSFQEYVKESFNEEISREKIHYVMDHLKEEGLVSFTTVWQLNEHILVTLTNKGRSLHEDGEF